MQSSFILIILFLTPACFLYAAKAQKTLQEEFETSYNISLNPWAVSVPPPIYHNPAEIPFTRQFRDRKIFSSLELPGLAITTNRATSSMIQKDMNHFVNKMLEDSKKDENKLYYVEPETFFNLILGGKNAPTIHIGGDAKSYNEIVTAQDPANLAAGPQTALISITNAQMTLGIGYRTRKGLFSIGLMLRPNYRLEMFDTHLELMNPREYKTAVVYGKTLSRHGYKSTAVGKDIGIKVVASDLWFPTFGISYLNIPDTCVEGYQNVVSDRKAKACGTARSGSTLPDNPNSKIDPGHLSVQLSIMPHFHIRKTRVSFKLSAEIAPIPMGAYSLDYTKDYAKMINAKGEMIIGDAFFQKEQALQVYAGLNYGGFFYGGRLNVFGIIALEFKSFRVQKTINQKVINDQRSYFGLAVTF